MGRKGFCLPTTRITKARSSRKAYSLGPTRSKVPSRPPSSAFTKASATSPTYTGRKGKPPSPRRGTKGRGLQTGP